jgi:mannosyltransferase OCH1-like enzyme
MKYLVENFDQLIEKSYGFNKQIYINSNEWQTAKCLYDNNYIGDTMNTPKIPKKIHQIWLGSDLPDKFKKFTESWKVLNPDWEYKLWTDNDVNTIKITKRRLFDFASNLGMKSDILRYEILKQFGGIYVDTDFECLKSFDDLINLEFFTGVSYDDVFVNYMGIIGSIPNHLIINACVNSMETLYNGGRARNIMNLTGPYYFTRCFNSEVTKETKGVVTFPMDFFYPFPNNKLDQEPYQFVKPFSYAIHHWAVSWVKH